ncbi:hypothetical protein EMCRGX_G022376 [Ephydatia muelleri]
MSKSTLKLELSILEKNFPRDHERFQVALASAEELVCKFVAPNGTKYHIQSNISPSYPTVLPLWTTDSADPNAVQLVEELNTYHEASADATHPLLSKVRYFITSMCKRLDIPVPSVVGELFSQASSGCAHADSGSEDMNQSVSDDETSDVEFEDGDDVDNEDDQGDEDMDLHGSDHEDIGGDEGIKEEHKAVLEKIRLNTRQEYLHGATSGSVRATDRLMRELQDIYRSQNFKDGIYSVELADDNLYNWSVKLLKVDPDSALYEDLKKMKETEGGYVLAGGAICMELLTPQGWSSAYTIEAVILQIGATLVKGKARIVVTQSKGETYTLAKAQHTYKSLVKIHEKSGWFTPPKDEG